MSSITPPPEPPVNGTEASVGFNDESRLNALKKVKGPAVSLMITAGITFLMQVYSVGSSLLGRAEPPDLSKLEGIEGMEWFVDLLKSPALMVFGIFVMAIAVLVLVGAMKMKSLQSYGWAMTAAVLAVIPCLSACCIGIPFGIWALIVLLNPEVKAAFV